MTARKKGGNVAEVVRAFVEPYARDLGLTVWDVRYLKEGADWFLRIFIDKPGGVFIEDCVELTRAVNAPLDALDPVSEAYILEVCSPGIDRELTRPEHFEAYRGERVLVRMIRPLENGLREFSGVLEGTQDDEVRLRLDGGTELRFMKKEASWVKLYDDFGGNEDE